MSGRLGISQTSQKDRRGGIMVFSAILLSFLFACVAFAVDVGILMLARAESQRAADAAVLAAAMSMYPEQTQLVTRLYSVMPDLHEARHAAERFARINGAGHLPGTYSTTANALRVHFNETNSPGGDIVFGHLYVPSDHSSSLIPTMAMPNAVQVRINLTGTHANSARPLFFARVLGFSEADVSATATAVVKQPVVLPFGTGLPKWNTLATGGDGDDYDWSGGGITPRTSDGIPEIVLRPEAQWDGQDLPPGNFGHLSIGGGMSGDETLRRQIDLGPTADEITYYGQFGEGTMVSGSTGISASVKTAFSGGAADGREYGGILGDVRYLPIYDQASGNGANALFRIHSFAAVRILYVTLQGGNKRIVVQPVTALEPMMTAGLAR